MTHHLWQWRQNSGGDRRRKVQFSEVQKVNNLDLDLGSGQGRISVHNTRSTTTIPDHMTAAWHSTEIWPFEFREISTFCKVWTPAIAFLEGNSKIGLRQAVGRVPYYHHQPSAARQHGGGDRPRKVQFSTIFGTLESPWPWSWPWIGLRSHWCAYPVEIYPHTKLNRNRRNFLWTDGSTYGWTEGRMDTPDFSKSIRTSPGDDLKTEAYIHY